MAHGNAQELEDWTAVGQAISDRLAELRLTQMDVASRAKVSLTTLRELQHSINPRRRRPQTLAAVSEALDWPHDYLAQILHGRRPTPHADESTDPVLHAIDQLRSEVHDLRARVQQIEQQLAGEGERP